MLNLNFLKILHLGGLIFPILNLVIGIFYSFLIMVCAEGARQLLPKETLPCTIKELMTLARYALNKTKYLLPPEVEHLLMVLDRFESKDPRNTLLIRLALKTGARAQEILSLRQADLNPYDETVYFRGLKNSNDREIPVSSSFFKKLKNFASSQDGDKIFPITYIRLYQIWENYKPAQKKFHSLRHTFAIQLYQKTKDLRLVQVALGHRNITNTMIYADYVYSQQELRKLIL